MSKELKMEVFASKEPVKSVRLHVYEFHTSELYENKYRLIRSAAWKIRNVNACGVFEDGSYIYTTEKISEEIPNVNFRLTYLGEQELGVLEHKKVYSELIKHWIIQKLRTVKIQKNSKECQMRKYQFCIRCSACDSTCPHGAIDTIHGQYTIDENKCQHCKHCIAKFYNGCIMCDVLSSRKGTQ